MKAKIPSSVISLLTSMLVQLFVIIGIGFRSQSTSSLLEDILYFLPAIFLIAGLPSLLLSAIASYLLKLFEASDSSILFASIAIGVVIGFIALVPVLMTGGM